MATCEKCGAEIPDGSGPCPKCLPSPAASSTPTEATGGAPPAASSTVSPAAATPKSTIGGLIVLVALVAGGYYGIKSCMCKPSGPKREWHGLKLGSSKEDVLAAAKAMGFSAECEDRSGPQQAVWSYDDDQSTWRQCYSVPNTVCSLKNPQKGKTGVVGVSVTLFEGKVCELALEFGGDETLAGLSASMAEKLGSVDHEWKRSGPTSMSGSYETRAWEDDDTSVQLIDYITNRSGFYVDLRCSRKIRAAAAQAQKSSTKF